MRLKPERRSRDTIAHCENQMSFLRKRELPFPRGRCSTSRSSKAKFGNLELETIKPRIVCAGQTGRGGHGEPDRMRPAQSVSDDLTWDRRSAHSNSVPFGLSTLKLVDECIALFAQPGQGRARRGGLSPLDLIFAIVQVF